MKQGIKNKDIERFEKAAERLKKVITDIQEYNPDAFLYCNMDSLELHGIAQGKQDFHLAEAAAQIHIPRTDCGER